MKTTRTFFGICEVNTLMLWCDTHSRRFPDCIDAFHEVLKYYHAAAEFYITDGASEYEEPHWGSKIERARERYQAFYHRDK